MNMRPKTLRRWLAAMCWAAATLAPAGSAVAHGDKAQLAPWPGGNSYERSVRSYAIPDVVLVDADARPQRLRDLLATDDPVMLNFLFTTCSTICPIMVRVFADVPPRMGAGAKDLRMISISIDPENDTPAKLKSYARNFGPNPRWHLLTGRLEDIKAVQRAFDSYRGDKMTHEPLTLIRHARGKSWVRIDGFATPDELVAEYRKPVTK